MDSSIAHCQRNYAVTWYDRFQVDGRGTCTNRHLDPPNFKIFEKKETHVT